MAVPTVARGTTRTMDGHVLACTESQSNLCQRLSAPHSRTPYKRVCNNLGFLKDWIQTHGNKGVDRSQQYGADQRRDVGKGQNCQHRQREDGADQQDDDPQTHKVLQAAQRQAPKTSPCVPHAHPYSYYETSCHSRENQRADVNGPGNTVGLLLAVAAELVEEELTGSETDVCHNYKRTSVHHRPGRSA